VPARLVLLPALAVSLFINVAIFGLAALFSRERPRRLETTEPVPINLISLPAPDLPEPAPVREPVPPEPLPRPQLQPDLLPAGAVTLAPPDIHVAIDRSIAPPSSSPIGFIFQAGELDRPPQPIVTPQPAYPHRARQREVEGEVRLRFLVGEDGAVRRISILEASPEGFFEESVKQTVARWRFRPGEITGRAVASWVETTIGFEFRD